MPIALQNLIILGDSLSDIGIKREAPTGMFARAFGAMRTNEIGRYSDGRNWTDFLIQWTGTDSLLMSTPKATEVASKRHRKLTAHSMLLGTNINERPPLLYANYAEGGAVGASDWKPMGGALGNLKEQVGRYIKARQALGPAFKGDTMHIVWIGLNDIVTAERSEGIDMYSADEPVRTATRSVAKKSGKGTGITPIVDEIKIQIDMIANAFPEARDHEHFLLVSLPSPTISVRFKDQMADGKMAAVDRFEKNTLRFNELLNIVAAHWPAPIDGKPGANPANISLVLMYDWMNYVADNAKAFQLTELAQQPGVPVLYRGQQDPVPPAIRRCLTTSDLAHPTEAVYELIARKIADDLLKKYKIGLLNQESWQGMQPYPKVASI